MRIKMAGIDHSRASLDDRERFSFTKAGCAAAIEEWKRQYPEAGIVLIATCNRTELWIHGEEADPFEMLCGRKGFDAGVLRHLSLNLEEQEAEAHLMRLACGMESRIFGEDQILSQVRFALELAREHGTADSVLDKLFLTAVTAAKRVKTEVRLAGGSTSVVETALDRIKQSWPSLKGRHCLVIGNGEMGRLAATRFLEEGCIVCMTIRQYRHGEVVIPFGCQVLPYDQRIESLKAADIVVSATASPHHTLHYEPAVSKLSDGKQRFLMDLAVPRDISVRLGALEEVFLYDIDTLGMTGSDLKEEQARAAREILDKYRQEFERWYHFRSWIPVVDVIGRHTALDTQGRCNKSVKQLGLPEKERRQLEENIQAATFKSVSKLLCGLRENLEQDSWSACLKALEQAAVRE